MFGAIRREPTDFQDEKPRAIACTVKGQAARSEIVPSAADAEKKLIELVDIVE